MEIARRRLALVTGAAGFIGSHLSERLLDDGTEVLGIDCLTPYYDPDLKRRNLSRLVGRTGFEWRDLDLVDADLPALVAEVDVVYHLAGQPGVRDSWGSDFAQYVRNNIIATQRLAEALRGSPTRLVVASSSSVYGDAPSYPTTEDVLPRPISPYGVTKLAAEQLVMAYRRSLGVDARCVRYFTVYGPRQRPDMAFTRFIQAVRRGDPIPVFGDGQQVRDFTYVADAVEATIRAGAIDEPGEAVYNVGGGSQVTVTGVLELLGGILGTPPNIDRRPSQPGDARRTGADLARAGAVLDWRPKTPLAIGLRAQVDAAIGDAPDPGPRHNA